ncbi:hypothetical protein HID58_068110, partial [Brassica napus]
CLSSHCRNYMKSKKANKKFNFKVFTETGPKTSLITDVTLRIKEASLLLEFLTLATHCMSGSMENTMVRLRSYNI